MAYSWIVLVHVLAVLVFVGNFVAAWLVWACARDIREPSVLARFYDLVNLGDRWLTPIPVIVILASGVQAARLRGLSVTGTGWIVWSLIALGASGLVFAGRLAGLQRSLAATARAAGGSGSFDVLAWRAQRAAWARWASLGTAAVLIAIALMVLKPAIPGL